MTEYTSGFKQYHKMTISTENRGGSGHHMGFYSIQVARCACGKWQSEWLLDMADKVKRSHKRHMEAAWKKRVPRKKKTQEYVWVCAHVTGFMDSEIGPVSAVFSNEKAAREYASQMVQYVMKLPVDDTVEGFWERKGIKSRGMR